MRKLLISLLLATAVSTPALAQNPNWQDRAAARQDRQNARQEARSERQQSRDESRAERPERSAPNYQPQQRNFEPQQRNFAPPAERNFTPPERMAPERTAPAYNQQAREGANWRDQRQERFDRQDRAVRPAYAGHAWGGQTDRGPAYNGTRRYTPPAYARPDRPAPVPETAYRWRGQQPNWSTDWRHDRRYDWRDYRDRHRSIFRLGLYYDPFGWGYQRFNIGWRLYPAYYSQSYWLTDPYMYDLPPAPYPLEWVRYYNDALLVNVFTGQVVDVMYDFFW